MNIKVTFKIKFKTCWGKIPINKANIAMRGTLIGAVIKNILLLILPIFLGIWGFVIASLINISYVTIQHIYYVVKSFR